MVRRLVSIVAAGLCLSMLAPFPAAGAQVPDPYARQLARQLASGERLTRDRGYAHVVGPNPGQAAQGEAVRFPVTLRASGDYVILAVCDARCTDVDMRLLDPTSGAVIAEDMLADDAPLVGARPARTGAYTIEIIMSRCDAPSCYFAFNVYGK